MEYLTYSLKNGIRLIHQPVNSAVAHCGVIINTGSRDELPEQHGMAHFIEHLIFKGTQKRRSHHILSRMEDVGGELNAYTTKEETCLHTTFYNNYYDRAFELMSDLLFHSIFPVKEIAKEREVIIDEINSYKDSPVEQLFDDFEELIFNHNPIARNILGTEESLNAHSRESLLEFYSENYACSEIVVSSAGKLPFKSICKYFEKHFAHVEEKSRTRKRELYNVNSYSPSNIKLKKNTYQAHCILGNQAYSSHDEKRLPLHLLNNLLGGPGMNSRLNMALRENRGLAYNVESNYSTYSDTGIVSLYFGTDIVDLKKCIRITLRELKNLRNNKLGTVQLARAKRQLIGQLAIASENNEQQMIANGRSLLLFDKVDTLEEITKKIQAISSEELLDVANYVFDPGRLSYLIYA